MEIKVKKLRETAIIPMYQTECSAGCDLCSDILMPIGLAPGETILVETGLAMEIPKGYVGKIYARSGLATNNGLAPINCVGIIDADYRGEIKVALHNHSNEDQIIYPQERIAQMMFEKYEQAEFKAEEKLTETLRGEGGFGSTGK